jgi:thiosulfate reductase cytochrome b subunit
VASKTVAWIYRHTVAVRITHWINVLCLTLLLMSGLQIFNAHPALYWGKASRFDAPFMSMTGRETETGVKGVTRIAGLEFNTTGLLGASRDTGGEIAARGFPSWLTVPSDKDLATGRRWHFLFAWLFVVNGLAYLAYSLFSGHLWRDLTPSRTQLRGIGRSIIDHALLRFDHGEDARAYNVLQKLAYLGVVAVLIAIVLTGLTMSPGINAAVPWLADLFGGRQSARTIHFLCATATVLFVLVHVVMVLLTGVWNNIRSMITGKYALKTTGAGHD